MIDFDESLGKGRLCELVCYREYGPRKHEGHMAVRLGDGANVVMLDGKQLRNIVEACIDPDSHLAELWVFNHNRRDCPCGLRHVPYDHYLAVPGISISNRQPARTSA